MKRHATTTLLRRTAAIAGYGEVTSASASIKAHTPHGYLGGLDFTVVYVFRGFKASKDAWKEETKVHTDALAASLAAHLKRPYEGPTSADTKDRDCGRLGPPPVHTWWPRQPHLCVMLSSLYTIKGIDFLLGLDDLNTAIAVVPGSAPHVADDLYERIHWQVALKGLADATHEHVGNPVGDWGVLPLLVFARARPIADSYEGEHWCNNENPNYRSRLPRFPWLASRQRPRTIGGLPDLDDSDAIGAFHTLAAHRDAALKSAITRGHHPYSYDGVRIMFQSLRRAEKYASLEGAAMISGLKDMRRQLYASPHRM
ncbi:hypothetical protein TW95_gp0879 [Pandoravirus inopinatum]|uniref:Uncharacterized protein n=1 Tax=Pandoravirus inopinatum TaxID=1605721 RepID=A0A0B5IXT8_9VIRU|nr:hypothetical protein TW95_gp0879 [Pandoravirus inopinatum]AJF97613.1 hypothetical protein [Pandoravirus inopinatum]